MSTKSRPVVLTAATVAATTVVSYWIFRSVSTTYDWEEAFRSKRRHRGRDPSSPRAALPQKTPRFDYTSMAELLAEVDFSRRQLEELLLAMEKALADAKRFNGLSTPTPPRTQYAVFKTTATTGARYSSGLRSPGRTTTTTTTTATTAAPTTTKVADDNGGITTEVVRLWINRFASMAGFEGRDLETDLVQLSHNLDALASQMDQVVSAIDNTDERLLLETSSAWSEIQEQKKFLSQQLLLAKERVDVLLDSYKVLQEP